MTDTPPHINDLQLAIWLKKTPEERLRQLMKDNEAILLFWKHAKPTNNNNNKVIVTKQTTTKI